MNYLVIATYSHANELSLSKRFEELSKKKTTIGIGIAADVHLSNKTSEENESIAEAAKSTLEESLSRIIVKANVPLVIVDRTHINSILQEQKLTNSGLVDEKSAIKLGKMAGVDIMYIFTLNDHNLVQKFLDVETGSVLLINTKEIPKPMVLLDNTINLYAGEGKSYAWKLEKGTRVHLIVNSNKPVSISLKSVSGEDLLFSNLKDIYNGDDSVQIPSDDDYILFVKSKALLLKAKATLSVTATPPFKMPE